MTEKQNVLIDEATLQLLNLRVDELTDENNTQETALFINSFQSFTAVFNNSLDEARFHYMLGNAYSVLFVPQHSEWFDPNLNSVIISFKKALKSLHTRNINDEIQVFLESQIETNLGNYLSQQGRFMCAKGHWKKAIELYDQPIAYTAIFQSEMFLSRCMEYDNAKAIYHQFLAYKSLCNRLELPNNQELYPDSNFIFENEDTQRFKDEFEANHQLVDFDSFYIKKDTKQSNKEKEYLRWCGDNNLFIDELEIDELAESIYPDSLSLPSISSYLNMTLAYHEDLVYHSNFDEIKTDFCYARYLIYSASTTPNDTVHFFNNTFPKTDDLTFSIDNLKAQHLKSAFKILYAQFDKIAYFISHFFNLNCIEKDYQISFENLFKNTRKKGEWKPNSILKDSENVFLHALFYILKDLRDIKDQESISDWLNPEIKKICEIRNYIEHRSFKLIDALYKDLVFVDEAQSIEIERLNEKKDQLTKEIRKVCRELKENKGTDEYIGLTKQKQKLEERLQHIDELQLDKQKRAQHTLIMTDDDFIAQLMTLSELVRNSIIYLSFSIEFENKNRSKNGDLSLHRDVPTKE